MRGVIIMGSSRSDGDTGAIAEKMKEFSDFDIIDLNLFNFSYYQ